VFHTVRESAITLANEIEAKEICSENMPPSLAAGVIAFVLRQMTKEEYPDVISYERIASVCGVSEGTLQKCMKRLEIAHASGLIHTLK
jgi:hypothetical protein